MAITLNPGFAVIIGAALAFLAPRSLRTGAMLASALAALFLIFAPNFGAGGGFAEIGLTITPLRLDPLAQIFGMGFGLLTVALAIFSASRDDRIEDVAFMAHAGGAMAAVFAGDLVSFVASAQFSALAGAVLVFRGPGKGALGAGVRFLCWHAFAGALMTAGVGLSWAQSGTIGLDRLSARTPEGACLFLGFAIMAGAPIAHVWVKDALQRTSALGGAALATFPLKLAAYAFARAFPGEPALLYLGAIAACLAVPLAALSQDVRQASGYGMISQSGAAVAAVGAGTPLALAGSAALSFASMFHGALALLAIGLACERAGGGRQAQLGGFARTMPMTALFAVVAALSAIGAPGFLGFTAMALHSDALAQQDRPLIWLALTAAAAGAALHIGGRIPYLVFFAKDGGARGREAPFAAQLGMGLAAFFTLAIGVVPSWLYALLPTQIYFHPYDWDHVIRQGELAAFALLAVTLASMAKLFPADQGRELVDADWLLRKAAPPALARAGAALKLGYDFGRSRLAAAAAAPRRAIAILAREGDRPAAPDAAGLVWAMVVLIVSMFFLLVFQT